jgi:hypothetical protein
MITSRPRPLRSAFILVFVAVLMATALTACGGDDATTTTTTPPSATTTTAGPTSTTASTSTTTAPPTTNSTTTRTTATTTTTQTPGLPGEPIDIGPAAGDVIAVIGVVHDDVLNLRAAPGTDQEILERLSPTEDGLVALGNARQLPQSIWYQVEYEGTTGWVSSSFVAYLGATSDVTASIIASMGVTPADETMLDLGTTIAEHIAESSSSAEITLTAAPTVGDLGEITLDVVGLEDDAVRGVRLHIFATPNDETFTLESVEQTLICGRGVDAEGLCV